MMTSQSERPTLTVVGAGPAGLAAAVHAAASGLPTTLVDAGERFGGQYWRHGPDGVRRDADLHHDVDLYTDLAGRAHRLAADGLLTHLPRHEVWTLEVAAGRAVVHALDRTDPVHHKEVSIGSHYLILATGAHDRQVPFPGWTLPGVVTVGGAQSLLKSGGVVVGPRVLVAGTGPFLLPVASGLAKRGATVVGVHDANHPVRWLRHLPLLVSQRSKVAEAARYAGTLIRRQVPVRTRSLVVAAHGTDTLEAVTVARLDGGGAIRSDTRERIPVDVLAVGYGFATQSELALLAGCTVRTTTDGALAVATDEEQRAGSPHVFAAGEITGIGGAGLAVAEGALAGVAAARAADLGPSMDKEELSELIATRARLRRFAEAMHSVYPVPAAWMESLQPDTVVCRCEEVTLSGIDAAICLGARDNRSVKLLSRAGMGLCQGRECAYATACLVARRTGSRLDLTSGAHRPVATPVPFGVVASPAR